MLRFYLFFYGCVFTILCTQGQWVSMGVPSDGSYGIDPGLVFSFPVAIRPDHSYRIVGDLELDEFAREKLDITKKELIEERNEALQACHSHL